MSWIFGFGNKPSQQFPPAAGGGDDDKNIPNQPAGQTTLTSAERKAMEAYRFDSSALERAAEAAKTLERSRKISKCIGFKRNYYYSFIYLF